ncbi:MAG: hypothetical protein K0R90_1336, partial [Oscillospiraceae bacterium]|nr:hypothetical protein [Oscillospiraceae bacterium]
MDILKWEAFIGSVTTDFRHLFFLLIAFVLSFIGLMYTTFSQPKLKSNDSEMIELTPKIQIPKPAGQNQYGSARFSTEEEQNNYYSRIELKSNSPLIKSLLEEGKKDYESIATGEAREIYPLAQVELLDCSGVPVAFYNSKNNEVIKIISEDCNTICFGATRSGKSRTLVIPSIGLMGLSGVDMINSDPKGELLLYTEPFLKRLGYKVYAFDFKNPNKSIRYNFLQFIINAINKGDISGAISCAWDFVDSLVKEPKTGEPLWSNGEKGLLAAAAMQVVFDNSPYGLKWQYPMASPEEIKELYETKHKHFQTCVNLYCYISEMTEENPLTKKLWLEDIISVLPDTHPSKMIMRIAQSAPSRTRGSFITSALATLKLFTDPNIADITSSTDEGLIDPDVKKAIFIILPDEKKTYYSLASLFVNQYYQFLVNVADSQGGRLSRDFKFNMDEIGNFTQIPFFDGKLTVGNGRGIHFNLYLQSRDQLVDKYGKELANIILDNCHYWIYLRSAGETSKLFSEKLDKYTVMAGSSSSSISDNGTINSKLSGSSSSSKQLTGRDLLTKGEVEKIERPYLLTWTNGCNAITQIPDLSKWNFNTMFGLG